MKWCWFNKTACSSHWWNTRCSYGVMTCRQIPPTAWVWKVFVLFARVTKVNAPCWCGRLVTEGARIKNSLIDKEAEGGPAPANRLSNALINQSAGEATVAGPVKRLAAAAPPAALLSAWRRRRITARRPSTCLRAETAADRPLLRHAGPRDQFSSHLMIHGVKWAGGGGGGGGQHMITEINRFN